MTLVQKNFYIENDIYRQLAYLAKIQKIPTARLMRSLIKKGLKTIYVQEQRETQFLLKLAKYKLKGGPKDLAKHHDRYTWE